MNIQQTATVLAKAAAVDNRDVGQAAVMAWHEIIGDLELAECLEAVARHRRDQPGVYLEPGHVRRIAKVIRDERRKGEVIKTLPPNRFELTSRGEPSVRGADRVREILAEIAAKKAVPEPDTNARPPTRSESIHARALARARAEKRTAR